MNLALPAWLKWLTTPSQEAPVYSPQFRATEALKCFEHNFLPLGMVLTSDDRTVIQEVIEAALNIKPATGQITTIADLATVLATSECRKARQLSEAYMASKADLQKIGPASVERVDSITIDSLCATRVKEQDAHKPHWTERLVEDAVELCREGITVMATSGRTTLRVALLAGSAFAAVVEWPLITVLFESTKPDTLAAKLRAAQIVASSRWDVFQQEFHVIQAMEYLLFIFFIFSLVLNLLRMMRNGRA